MQVGGYTIKKVDRKALPPEPAAAEEPDPVGEPAADTAAPAEADPPAAADAAPEAPVDPNWVDATLMVLLAADQIDRVEFSSQLASVLNVDASRISVIAVDGKAKPMQLPGGSESPVASVTVHISAPEQPEAPTVQATTNALCSAIDNATSTLYTTNLSQAGHIHRFFDPFIQKGFGASAAQALISLEQQRAHPPLRWADVTFKLTMDFKDLNTAQATAPSAAELNSPVES